MSESTERTLVVCNASRYKTSRGVTVFLAYYRLAFLDGALSMYA